MHVVVHEIMEQHRQCSQRLSQTGIAPLTKSSHKLTTNVTVTPYPRDCICERHLAILTSCCCIKSSHRICFRCSNLWLSAVELVEVVNFTHKHIQLLTKLLNLFPSLIDANWLLDAAETLMSYQIGANGTRHMYLQDVTGTFGLDEQSFNFCIHDEWW